MDAVRRFEICQEARFVLWALRCAIAVQRGDPCAEDQLNSGFELADVTETIPAFRDFMRCLGVFDWPATVWHAPSCGCVSREEMLVLRALAETAAWQRGERRGPGPAWLLLLPVGETTALEHAAAMWLAVLERAGVIFPAPPALLESLTSMETLVEPAQRVPAVRH